MISLTEIEARFMMGINKIFNSGKDNLTDFANTMPDTLLFPSFRSGYGYGWGDSCTASQAMWINPEEKILIRAPRKAGTQSLDQIFSNTQGYQPILNDLELIAHIDNINDFQVYQIYRDPVERIISWLNFMLPAHLYDYGFQRGVGQSLSNLQGLNLRYLNDNHCAPQHTLSLYEFTPNDIINIKHKLEIAYNNFPNDVDVPDDLFLRGDLLLLESSSWQVYQDLFDCSKVVKAKNYMLDKHNDAVLKLSQDLGLTSTHGYSGPLNSSERLNKDGQRISTQDLIQEYSTEAETIRQIFHKDYELIDSLVFENNRSV